MIDITFKMDLGAGFVTVPPPRNWKDMKIQLIFDNPDRQQQLQSIVFEWVKANATAIDNYIRQGMTGGTGIFEGIGLRIYVGTTSPILIFDGCIDTANPGFDFQSDIIKAPIKESGKIDWLNDVAQSITFEYLTSLPAGAPGRITRSDYKQVPYALSTIPNYTQAMLLSISLFIIIKESVDVTMKIVSLTARAISQSLSWLQLIGTIIEIVLYLIYLGAIVVASAKLMQEIANNLIQPKKTKLAMREVDLFTKGCAYFGLNFVSSIYGAGVADAYKGKYINMTLLPKKIKIPDGDPSFEVFVRPPDETTNPKSFGYYEGTFKQFIVDMEMTYHARAVIRGNTLYFEEINNFNLANAYRLPNEGVVGNTFLYPQPYSTNASEIPAVYIISFQKDEQDLNTYEDYIGTYVVSQATPTVIRNQKNQLLSGMNRVDLPFALARRKVGYDKLEKQLLDLLTSFTTFISSIGDRVDHINNQLSSWLPTIIANENTGASNTQIGVLFGFLTGQPVFSAFSLIFGSDGLPIIPTVTIPTYSNDRIGWLLLSNDFVGVKKRFVGVQNGDDWYIDSNNSAGTLTFAPTVVSGVFTGTITGPVSHFGMIGQTFTGTIVAGVLTGSCPVLSPGTAGGVVVGTVAGLPGLYAGGISGFGSGGIFNGSGAMSASGGGGGAGTSVTTDGWGSAQELLNDFHYTGIINDNQWLIFKDKKFKFGKSDWNAVSNNNVLVTSDGKIGKFEKIIWDLHNDIATDVTYRIKQKYTNNYTLKTSTDGG